MTLPPPAAWADLPAAPAPAAGVFPCGLRGPLRGRCGIARCTGRTVPPEFLRVGQREFSGERKLYGLEPNPDGTPREVRFDDGGEERFWEEKRRINREKFRPGFPATLGYAWDKMDSQLARLSLLLAMVRVVSEGGEEAVTGEDVDRAAKVLRYFMAHARRAHAKTFGETKEARWLWVLNDLLDERGDEGGAASWRVASADLRDLFAASLHDVPEEEPEQFTRELREMAERGTDGRISVMTGKRVEHTRRGVEIRRTPHATPRARRPRSGSAGSTEESALSGMAPDLILLALEDLGEAYPREIAEATGLSPKTVTNNLPELKRKVKICYTGKTGPGGAKQVALVPDPVSQWEVPKVGFGPKGDGLSYFGELKE